MKIDCRKRRARNHETAFTLVEVVIGVLVLAIMATSLYSAFSYGFSTMQASREDLRATQIVMQKTEGVRLCTWSELRNINFQEAYDPRDVTNGGGGTTFFGTVRTNAASAVPSSCSYQTNMRLVTVTVYWTNYYGSRPQAHSRQAQTEVARYGMQNYIWGLSK